MTPAKSKAKPRKTQVQQLSETVCKKLDDLFNEVHNQKSPAPSPHPCHHESDWGEVKMTMKVIRETLPELADGIKVNQQKGHENEGHIIQLKAEKRTAIALVGSIIATLLSLFGIYWRMKK